ncbi:high affinity immunoglobulin gamma Fc receptor I-like [Lithobates pipiens]
MTCNGGNNLTYQWFQNNTVVAEGQNYTITSAQPGHSGIYQCRTILGISAPFKLDVHDGPVILQASSNILQGREMTLRCYSRPGYIVYRTTFYKDNVKRGAEGDGGSLILPGSKNKSGNYRCDKRLFWEEYVFFTDEASIPVRVKERITERITKRITEYLILKIAIPLLALVILIIWAVLLFTCKLFQSRSKRQMVKTQRAPSTEEEEVFYAKLVITKKGKSF